jgi:hypothetical protein
MRGGIRRLHPAGVVVAALLAVAVGWFLPLLGISLVGFLVVDALDAALKARSSAKSA